MQRVRVQGVTAAGVTLGPIRAITDVIQPQVDPYAVRLVAAATAAPSASGVPVPVQPGTENVTAEVMVSYDVG